MHGCDQKRYLFTLFMKLAPEFFNPLNFIFNKKNCLFHIMTFIRNNIVFAALHRAYGLIDYNIQDNLEKQFEFRKRINLLR